MAKTISWQTLSVIAKPPTDPTVHIHNMMKIIVATVFLSTLGLGLPVECRPSGHPPPVAVVPAVVPFPLPDVLHTAKAAAVVLGGVLHHIKHKAVLIGPIVGKVIHTKLSLLPNIKHAVAAILSSSSAYAHPVPVPVGISKPVPAPSSLEHVLAPILPNYGAPYV